MSTPLEIGLWIVVVVILLPVALAILWAVVLAVGVSLAVVWEALGRASRGPTRRNRL